MKSYVYGLSDPLTFDRIRYIGWALNPADRLGVHIREAINNPDNGNYRWRWIRSVLEENRIPMFQVLEEADSREEVLLLEIKWIKYYRELGHKLTNATDGGEGGIYPLYDATRQRISEASRRNWTDPDYKQRVLEKIAEAWKTSETLTKARATHIERWKDPEERKNQSIRLTNHFKKSGSREVASLANRKYREDPVKRSNHKDSYTPEVRSQMSESTKKFYENPEARDLHSARMIVSWSEQSQEARDKRAATFASTIAKRKQIEKDWTQAYIQGERDYTAWLKRYDHP